GARLGVEPVECLGVGHVVTPCRYRSAALASAVPAPAPPTLLAALAPGVMVPEALVRGLAGDAHEQLLEAALRQALHELVDRVGRRRVDAHDAAEIGRAHV